MTEAEKAYVRRDILVALIYENGTMFPNPESLIAVADKFVSYALTGDTVPAAGLATE